MLSATIVRVMQKITKAAIGISVYTLFMLLGAVRIDGHQTTDNNSPSATISLTSAESAWIAGHKQIKVGIDPSFPPLKFRDNGAIKGLEIDYLKLLSEKTGLQFDLVAADFARLDDQIKSGEVDMFISFYIPERLAYTRFTDPMMDFRQIIVTRQNAPFMSGLSALKGMRVATVKGVKLYDKLLSHYPEIRTVPVSTMDQMFRAVSEHRADALISRTLYAGHIINNYPNLKVAGVVDLPPEPYRYAVRKDYPELVAILNKALSTISRDQHDQLAQKWFNITIDYRARWSDIPVWVYLVCGMAALFITIIVISNRRLKREIAGRITAEQVQADSEKQLGAIINTSDAGIILVSPQGVIAFANNRMADLFAMPLSDMIGSNYIDHLYPSERQIGDERMRQLMSGEIRSVSLDCHYIRTDGTDFWGHLSGSRMDYDDGSLRSLVGVISDITQRKLAEDALRETEAAAQAAKRHLEEAQRIAHLGSWQLDIVHDQLSWSQECYAIFGVPNGTPLTLASFVACIHPDDHEMVVAAWTGALAGEPYNITHRICVGDTVKWVVERATIVFDDHGSPLHGIGTVQDITDRKKMLDSLQESEERYRNLVDNLQNVVVYQITGDLEGARYFTYISRAVERLNEVSVEDVLADAQVIYRQILPRYHERLQQVETEAISNLTPLHIEVESILPSGALKWFEYTVSPRIRHDGQVIWDGVEVDITRLKQTEHELIEAKMSSDAANVAKSEFLANMSHEIRTPMNGVVGMTHLLRTTELTSEQEQYLANIEISANSLITLISDILDLSKIEAGKMVLESATFSLRRCIDDVLASQQYFIQQKAIRVTMEIADGIPNILIGDQLRTRQILLNILGNAIKFTEQGQIDIVAELIEQRSGDVHVRIVIKDTGIGMSEELQERIFAPFVQADTSTTRRYGGSGLGLTICRRLAALMGGKIRVESQEGIGSSFSIDLHFNEAGKDDRPPSAAATAELMSHSQKLTILLAEDNRVNAEFIYKILSKLGHRVVCVENGQQALDIRAHHSFDCILMDIQMPVLGGDAATRIIREQEQQSGGHIPIIALTAHAMHEERRKILEQGFDAHIAKPVDVAQLLAELQKVT